MAFEVQGSNGWKRNSLYLRGSRIFSDGKYCTRTDHHYKSKKRGSSLNAFVRVLRYRNAKYPFMGPPDREMPIGELHVRDHDAVAVGYDAPSIGRMFVVTLVDGETKIVKNGRMKLDHEKY